MSISASDIKFRKPERLTDFNDGGGRMVWPEIPDGQLNNLFSDVASGDRVWGRVSLRKPYVHVATPTTDILAQAMAVLVQRPVDPAVEVMMFSTGSSSDTRIDAQRYIETFRMPANESPYVLYGNHQPGTQVLSVFGRVGMPDPEIGDVIVLSVEAPGYAARQEAVKVESILSRQTQTFWDAVGEFERDVMNIALTRPLTATDGAFPGMAPARNFSTRPPTLLRATRANDSARFYGTEPLAEDVIASPSAPVSTIRVPSIYGALVPATTQRQPLVDVLAGQGVVSNTPSGAEGLLSLSFSAALVANGTVTRFFGMGCAPGSVNIMAGSTPLVDDGGGNITAPEGEPPTLYGGTVDYDTGRLVITHSAGIGNTSFTVTAQPAAPVLMQSFTAEIAVGLNNQSTSYIDQLIPTPAPGSVVVDYRANGEWIRLRDTGNGALAGAPGQGSGTINYATGGVSLSLPALPDIGSSIIWYWGTGKTTQRHEADSNIEPPEIAYTVDAPGIAPGSLEISYLVSASPVTLTDNGAGRILSGVDVVGRVVYSTGEIAFRPPTLPDSNSQINTKYDSVTILTEQFTPAVSGGSVSFTLGTAPVEPGSVRIRWTATVSYMWGNVGLGRRNEMVEVYDNGAGGLWGLGLGAAFLGTIDYNTGAVTLDVEEVHPTWVPEFSSRRNTTTGALCMYISDYTLENVGHTFEAGTTVTATWAEDSPSTSAEEETINLPPVVLDLTPGIIDTVTPGSVRFQFRGRTYVDRQGLLVYDVDPLTNAGTTGGSVDYASGRASITEWAAGGGNSIQVQSLLTSLKEPGVSGAFFRAPGSPLQAGSFTLRAVRLDDGTQITATADINGNITGAGCEGVIDWTSGVISLNFGAWVSAAGQEAEPWYDPEAVVGGQIWKPAQVLPSTIFIGVVVLKYTTVSPTLIGLDAIMLPNDGRVVKFRPGMHVLICDERTEEVAVPVAGSTVDLGRTELSQIEVRDAVGTPVSSEWYHPPTKEDLELGQLRLKDPLPIDWNTAGYTLPLMIRHRVDARRGIVSARITGEIELNAPLTRDFEAATTLVCSGVILGEAYGSPDIQARVSVFFDQQSDEVGVFKDELVGNPATASYNIGAFPIELTNRGAITERWKLRFINSTEFVVIGESEGQLAGTFNIANDCAPINPRTITLDNPGGDPYFTLRAGGWGSGWATSNILRPNTVGAEPALWVTRTTQPSDPADIPQDSVRLQVVGDD